ncbi:MAG: hypothetical protein L6R37_004622 [Teloschistes peruensis]|nr:MAG: hypothetical protein L6R37_004622 [Teloschistes peruensis]
MVDTKMYTVRPYNPAKAKLKDAFRIFLSSTELHSRGFRPGDSCQLRTNNNSTFLAIVWPATDNIQNHIIQTSKTLQNLYNLKLGDHVHLARSSNPIPEAHYVSVTELEDHDTKSRPTTLGQAETAHWAWLIEYELQQAEVICPGLMFANIRAKGQSRSFKITTINDSEDLVIYQSSTVRVVTVEVKADQSLEIPNMNTGPLELDCQAIGGLNVQISRLNAAIARYGSNAGSYRFKPCHQPRRSGVILHGPAGTGKSMLLRMVAAAGWRKVFYIRDNIGGSQVGEGLKAIKEMFAEAHRHQPSLVVIDNLHIVARKNEPTNPSLSLNVADSLCEELDRRGDSRVLVLAATRDLSLIDETLRCPGRFQTEIEIPVPGSDARAEILHVAYDLSKAIQDPQLTSLASRTHGYVGSDLVELIQVAMDHAGLRIKGVRDQQKQHDFVAWNEESLAIHKDLKELDIETALQEVRPTAMKEIFLDTPKVHWADIGGQSEVKKALQVAVEWPLKYPLDTGRLRARPKKGLLLYGPPGCSKTLMAKAVATEMRLNFIAIKGAEILNMYVGESERAVREIFRKARVASPSIIFFDEVDAIGASREYSPQGGIHVLTTLLNELDGIEALKGVFVLAATNRPEILDPALLRPGRLDSKLFVGLPDNNTRREIVTIEARKVDVGRDFDARSIAELTDGYSGAELVNICLDAGDAALEEQLETGHYQTITMRHIMLSLQKARKQVSPEMISRYEAWGARERT